MAEGGITVTVGDKSAAQQSAEEVQAAEVREFLLLALKRFRTIADAESELRGEMLDDLRFRAGDQWPASIKHDRESDGRPCLTVNRIPTFIRQITNQQRNARAGVQVSPVGGDGDAESAEAIQGLIRNIERMSDADVAYTTAGEHQATIGRGFVRVLTEWEDPGRDSRIPWTQTIRIRRVRNPFTVYLDPAMSEPDGSDARYGFVIEDMPREEYDALYHDGSGASAEVFQGVGDTELMNGWLPEGKVRVAEYFYTDHETEEYLLVENANGERRTLQADQFDPALAEEHGAVELARREVRRRTVKWAKISATEILDGNEDKTAGRDWPGQTIPIVQMLGDEIEVDGRLDVRGIVREGKDPQRMFNFWRSAKTEMIALAPKAPFIGAKGQFESQGQKWRSANTRNYAYLEYDPVTADGKLAPAPQRQQYEPPIQAIAHEEHATDNDLKSVMGFHDASMGERGPQESGRAIRERKQQDQLGSSHFLDNHSKAIRAVGRILVDLIPAVYDTEQVIRILGVDDQPKQLKLHPGFQALPPEVQEQIQAQLDPGISGIFDPTFGRYDVAVSTGPSYETQRQESVEALVGFIQAYPDAFPVIGDLIAENMDWPGAQVVGQRLKRWAISRGILPQDDDSTEDWPPEAIAQIEAMKQQLQKIGESFKELQQDQETDKVKAEMQALIKRQEIESRERIETLKVQAGMMQTEAKLSAQNGVELIRAEVAQLQQVIDKMHDRRERATDRADASLARAETAIRQQRAAASPAAPAMPNQTGRPGGTVA